MASADAISGIGNMVTDAFSSTGDQIAQLAQFLAAKDQATFENEMARRQEKRDAQTHSLQMLLGQSNLRDTLRHENWQRGLRNALARGVNVPGQTGG